MGMREKAFRGIRALILTAAVFAAAVSLVWALTWVVVAPGLSPDTAVNRPVIPPVSAPEAGPDETGVSDTHTLLDLSGYALHRGDLVLINSKIDYVDDGEIELVVVDDVRSESYTAENRTILVSPVITDALNRFFDDFAAETGLRDIVVISGHRTPERQQLILDGKAAQVGLEEAKWWVALPGKSEHHTGLAVDIGVRRDNGTIAAFRSVDSYTWLIDNAHRYGFIPRYPEEKRGITLVAYEPWHFRYVGQPHAHLITELGFCYEEYVDHLRDFSPDAPLLFQLDGTQYEIFFTGEASVCIPKDTPYAVSGNNVDGLIVTLEKAPAAEDVR